MRALLKISLAWIGNPVKFTASAAFGFATTGPAFANGLAWRNCERFMISPRHPDEVCAEILETAE
jgi:hypothetical protein